MTTVLIDKALEMYTTFDLAFLLLRVYPKGIIKDEHKNLIARMFNELLCVIFF